jgi:hypothetical protein
VPKAVDADGISYWLLARRRLITICPAVFSPFLSIRPTFLAVFDAGLMADAGGEKRASRSGCQD